jgi:hypothetical protein
LTWTRSSKFFAAAGRYYEAFLHHRAEIGDRWGVAWGRRGLGAVAQAQGWPERAARLQVQKQETSLE